MCGMVWDMTWNEALGMTWNKAHTASGRARLAWAGKRIASGTARLIWAGAQWLLAGAYMASTMAHGEFNKKSISLYTILRSSRLAGSQRAPFLRRFLLRLNFNAFFEVISYQSNF
ncbi:hypothetical protein GIB67_028601 [Kingdonia uniflora]|uniref:Uncharacterized protein n=1 Tax=Kingdonia uniflora TaxID=39325 RepID=A0A7J7KZE3_9MAGN|nr:hypothetical protein GIB67_028601 [Kingdonia uniflora]